MSGASLAELQHAAEDIARGCRKPILDGHSRARVELKSDGTVVTQVDVEVQARVFSEIHKRYPAHVLVGEEEGGAPLTSRLTGYAWVVDPIDGTRNFASGFPCFATSIAVLLDGEPIVGVVAEHVSGQVYSAAAGQGARLDGQLIRADEGSRFRKRMVAVPTSMDATTQRVVAAWLRREDLILRNTGSAALHLALVAGGALCAAYGFQCKVWDIAAGVVLVREAGGVLTGVRGEALFPWHPLGDPERNLPCLAGAPLAHRELLSDFA